MTSIDDMLRFLDAWKQANVGVFEPTKAKRVAKKNKARKASAYSKRYGAAFKKLAPKYKTKAGKWKKDGFKRCAAAARKVAKK